MSRTANAIKNLKVGFICRTTTLIIGFVSRTVFIYYLGSEFLGIEGLYTQILAMLSLAELGFGWAIHYAMYKPIAEGDDETIVKLLSFYRRVYAKIAFVVLGIGVLIIPFLPNVIQGVENVTLFELRIFYCIFLFNNFIRYFVCYKYTLVDASQKNYISTNIEMVINLVTITLQIIVLVIYKNFLIYLLAKSFLLLCSRIIVSIYLNKKFPIFKLRPTVELTKEEKKPIMKNVRSMAMHQAATLAVDSTDNIIISMFSGAGIAVVGVVSNYSLITSSVISFVLMIFTSATVGFGNIVAQSTTENYRKVFLEVNFIGFWIYGFCVTAFITLIPPFITLWIGAKYLIETKSFVLIILNLYLIGQGTVYHYARIAKGEFHRDKWIGCIQAVINLVVSIICASKFGLVGVYIGTTTSRIFYLIFRPYVTYRFLFGKSSKEYYFLLAKNLAIVIFASVVTVLATKNILIEVNIFNFLSACVIVTIIPNLIFAIACVKTKELAMVIKRAKSVLNMQ